MMGGIAIQIVHFGTAIDALSMIGKMGSSNLVSTMGGGMNLENILL